MNPSEFIIKNSIKNAPIGETDNFIWFICDIGIVAIFKFNKNIPEVKILNEALSISLDLSKEEKENYLIEGKKVVLYYS
tara:strand:- start:94 stop:330 length:237 start_codon:yes stop_codon:yes gene_type:complete